MAKYVALLRAINVGGTGKLPMTDLKALCEDAGFAHVQTYIASGNVVFESAAPEPQVKAAPSQAVAIFLDTPPPRDALDHAVHVNDEKMALGKREIFVHYGSGMGRSKLRIPAAKAGTMRNMNTIAKLAELAAKLGPSVGAKKKR
jgi:uncharacterized protein (DUF1697 family)